MSATLATTVDLFLADMQRSSLRPSTLTAYRRELRAAAVELCAPMELLQREELHRWVGRGNASPSTVARRCAILRRLFSWAVATGRSRCNPLEAAGRRVGHKPARPPIAEQRSTLDAAINQAPMPFRLAFVLLRETPLRISEVLALSVGDVCVTPGYESLFVRGRGLRGELTVLLGPIATPRTLRLLQYAVHTRRGNDTSQPLLQGPIGPLSYSALRYQWNRLCLRSGLVDDYGAPRYALAHLGHARDHIRVRQPSRKTAKSMKSPAGRRARSSEPLFRMDQENR